MANQGEQEKMAQEHLLEQYKLYVEMMDRVTTRRGDANKFYLSLISALLSVLMIFSDSDKNLAYSKILFLLFSILGLVLCVSWWFNINSYKQLNYLKFKVIYEIEERMPFPCYKREWEIEQNQPVKYRRLSKIEKFIPILLGFIYLVLTTYSVLAFLSMISKG